MEGFEDMFEFGKEDILEDIIDLKEEARVKGIVNNLALYNGNQEEITRIYTEVLLDDNVSQLLIKLTKEPIFVKHFPELYNKNEYGEDVINCQQNSTYHKYGVFKHILVTIENVCNAQIPFDDWQKKILKWTMFLHDIGKPYVKVLNEDGTDSFAGHDDLSVELAQGILGRLYFTDEEKKIILTLIKYHDKFLNEGEIIYENLKILANELENDKNLFNLLIQVKEADAKAKNLDVYNKYKLTKNKYIEFANEYFSINSSNDSNYFNNNVLNKNLDSTTKLEDEEVSDLELNHIIENVLAKRNITTLYQPIIDIENKMVHGYEIFTKIDYTKRIDIYRLFNYAKDIGKYEKIQQILLIKGIEDFESVSTKEADKLFIKIDLNSYVKYINKPRIYDMMNRNKIVISFSNYDKKDMSEFKELIDTIQKNNGFVALDNFGIGSLSIDDISILNVDYIIPDISTIKDILRNEEKQKYISNLVLYTISKDINLSVIGVEDIETLELLKKLGVKYAQGYYFSRPSKDILQINHKLEELFASNANDKIV